MGDEVQVHREAVSIADEERERAIGWLRHHCGAGALTLDEFGDRAGEVYAARTEVELWQALDGLQVPRPTPGADVPERAVTPAGSTRAGRRWHIAVFGSADRRGRWRIAPSSVALAMFGGVTLDLRSVTLEDPDAAEITINGCALFGGVDILVPEGMDVDINGLALFGGKDCRLADVPRNPSLPLLRVNALVLFGGLDVRSRRSPAEEKRAREHRREHRREQKRTARELRRG